MLVFYFKLKPSGHPKALTYGSAPPSSSIPSSVFIEQSIFSRMLMESEQTSLELVIGIMVKSHVFLNASLEQRPQLGSNTATSPPLIPKSTQIDTTVFPQVEVALEY